MNPMNNKANYALSEETFYPTPRLVKLIKKYSKGKILDVGCGKGAYFEYFNGKEIYGIDINDLYLKSIDRNKFPGKKIVLKKSDIRKLPFKNGMFDFVVSSLVLEYMKTEKELSKAIHELKRVLKKNGILIVATPHRNVFTIFVRGQIINRILPRNRKDPNFIMGVTRSKQELEKFGFTTRGCLGWVTYKALRNEPLAKFFDFIFWNIPFFSGTLVGIYKKH